MWQLMQQRFAAENDEAQKLAEIRNRNELKDSATDDDDGIFKGDLTIPWDSLVFEQYTLLLSLLLLTFFLSTLIPLFSLSFQIYFLLFTFILRVVILLIWIFPFLLIAIINVCFIFRTDNLSRAVTLVKYSRETSLVPKWQSRSLRLRTTPSTSNEKWACSSKTFPSFC